MMGGNNNGASKISLGTTKVDMPCYIGPQVEESVILPDGASKCMLYDTPVSFYFKLPPSYSRAQDFVYNPIVTDIDGEKVVCLRTGSSPEIKFHASWLIDQGYVSPVFTPNLEDLEIQRYREVTDGDKAISYFKLPEEVRLVVSPERLATFDPEGRDTPLRKFVTDIIDCEIPNNLLGKYLSYTENFRQALRRTLFEEYRTRYDQHTVDFIDFLLEKYGIPRDILGIGSEKMDAVARIYPDNKSSYLVGSTDFHEKAKAMAEAYGLEGRKAIEFFEKYVIYHEFVHNFERIKSKTQAEIETAETLMEYFIRKAGELEGAEEGKLYRILAKEAEAYAECYRKNGNLNSKFKSKNLESKIAKLEVEARNLNLEGKEARDYITKKLDEEVDSKERDLEGEIDETDRKYESIEGKDYNRRETSDECTGESDKGETTDDGVEGPADEVAD